MALHEALLLRPLPDGLLLHLNLTVSTSSQDLRHLELFPRAIAELVLSNRVAEAHVSLTRGRWLHERWGAQPEPAPLGGVVAAWLPTAQSQRAWDGLRQALGASLCASLSEAMDMEGEGEAAASGDAPLQWPWMESAPSAVPPLTSLARRWAVWGREAVCTENIAAWLQLWPCRDAAGPARLLGGALRPQLLGGRFTSLRLRLLRECASIERDDGSCEAPRLVLRLGLTVLTSADAPTVLAAIGGGGPTPASGGGADGAADGVRACPLATSSRLQLQLPAQTAVGDLATTASDDGDDGDDVDDASSDVEVRVAPRPTVWNRVAEAAPAWQQLEWPLSPTAPLHLRLQWSSGAAAQQRTGRPSVAPPPLGARRTVGGWELQRAALELRLVSRAAVPMRVEGVEHLPWRVVPAAHTLALFLNGTATPVSAPLASLRIAPPNAGSAPRSTAAAPPLLGASASPPPPPPPHRLEWRVTLPPFTTMLLSLQLERPFIPVDELPSDASRGIDLGSVALRYQLQNGAEGADEPTRLLFTEGALLPVPLADQSMPYNVISITSTLLALFGGSMFNLLARRHLPLHRPDTKAGTK